MVIIIDDRETRGRGRPRHTGLWISAANILVTGAVGEHARDGFLFVLGYTPPPPWSIGIIVVAGNCAKILEPQSLAGKILFSKDLCLRLFRHIYRLRLDHTGLIAQRRQGQMSHGVCGSYRLVPFARNSRFLTGLGARFGMTRLWGDAQVNNLLA